MVGWRVNTTLQHHVRGYCSFLYFFCFLLAQFYNTSFLPWHQVPSTSFFTQSTNPVTTDFASTDPMHGQSGSRSPWLHRERPWPSAGPGPQEPSCLCEGSVMFAPHRFHSRPYHWDGQVFDCFFRPLLGGLSFMPFLLRRSRCHKLSPKLYFCSLFGCFITMITSFLLEWWAGPYLLRTDELFFSIYDQSLLVYPHPPRWSHIAKAPGPWLALHGLCLLLGF